MTAAQTRAIKQVIKAIRKHAEQVNRLRYMSSSSKRLDLGAAIIMGLSDSMTKLDFALAEDQLGKVVKR